MAPPQFSSLRRQICDTDGEELAVHAFGDQTSRTGTALGPRTAGLLWRVRSLFHLSGPTSTARSGPLHRPHCHCPVTGQSSAGRRGCPDSGVRNLLQMGPARCVGWIDSLCFPLSVVWSSSRFYVVIGSRPHGSEFALFCACPSASAGEPATFWLHSTFSDFGSLLTSSPVLIV